MSAKNNSKHMSRKEAWDHYSSTKTRTSITVFLTVFKTIYDILEQNPNALLMDEAETILTKLARAYE